jgi:hypothetical protein
MELWAFFLHPSFDVSHSMANAGWLLMASITRCRFWYTVQEATPWVLIASNLRPPASKMRAAPNFEAEDIGEVLPRPLDTLAMGSLSIMGPNNSWSMPKPPGSTQYSATKEFSLMAKSTKYSLSHPQHLLAWNFQDLTSQQQNKSCSSSFSTSIASMLSNSSNSSMTTTTKWKCQINEIKTIHARTPDNMHM